MAQRTWTVQADKGRGLTAKELLDVLELAPPGYEPKVTLQGFSGKIKSITVQTNRDEEQPKSS